MPVCTIITADCRTGAGRHGRILVISMLPRSLALIAGCMLAILSAADWPAYRGPGASGVGQGAAPSSWNGDASTAPVRNIKWKTPIPGLSHSSPVIVGNKLLVTTAISSAGKAPLKIGLY